MGCYRYVLAVFLSGVLSQEDVEIPKCTPEACPPTAICKEGDGFIYCDCPVGKTGLNCTEDDPCLPRIDCPEGYLCYGPCDPNIVCIGATGLPHCRGCVPGYTGIKCDEDVDECRDFPDICANNGTCVNVFADFKCVCTEEWTGKECDCLKGSECDVETLIETTTKKEDVYLPSTTPSGVSNTQSDSLRLLLSLSSVVYCLCKSQI